MGNTTIKLRECYIDASSRVVDYYEVYYISGTQKTLLGHSNSKPFNRVYNFKPVKNSLARQLVGIKTTWQMRCIIQQDVNASLLREVAVLADVRAKEANVVVARISKMAEGGQPFTKDIKALATNASNAVKEAQTLAKEARATADKADQKAKEIEAHAKVYLI